MSSAKKTLLALVLPLATTACSNGSASVSNTANAANSDFVCEESISVEEGTKASYDQYCKLNTGGKFTVEPKTIDTSAVGTTEQGLTLTDSAGNISYVIIPVTVKAKPTPSPASTPASTPETEATQDSQTESKSTEGNKSNQQASAQQSAGQQSSQQSTVQQPAVQQSTTQQQTQPSQQQATQNYDVEDNSSLSGPSAPSGSTYDTLQACQANMGNGGGASTVGCVWNDELRKYVLTY